MEMWRLAPGQRIRALVVDDVLENRKVLSTMLGMAGCETVVAENCAQAIEAVRDCPPDIVFMDLRLPGEDGIETTRQLVTRARPEAGSRGRDVGVGSRRGTRALPGRRLRRVRRQAVSRRADLRLRGRPVGRELRGPVRAVDVRRRGSHRRRRRMTLPEDLASRLSRAAELHSATAFEAVWASSKASARTAAISPSTCAASSPATTWKPSSGL